ncbi:MAG: carboxypeptidase-like regulatory domain-containing protein [Muribaculaceae bacterium]|nr:carboxypeptidase-like regulatory domain-containing protein [Muribaculaceae bacterium]
MALRKFICILILAALTATAYGANEIVVLDAADGSPLAGASVISSEGLIVGFSDGYGRLSAEDKDFPLSVRSIGYEAREVAEPCDTIMLQPATYMLSELVISPIDRPITRVVAFAREYCSGSTSTDTFQLFCEYMLEFFYADGKVKGYSKSDENATVIAVRRYGRTSNSHGLDSIMRPRYDDDISTLSFLTNMAFVPYKDREETEAIKGGAMVDTLQGKYYPKQILRKGTTLFTVEGDMLADYKDHRWSPWFFKLFGLTTELQEANWTLAYALNDSGTYSLYDFIGGTYNMQMLGKGKIIKKIFRSSSPIGMNCMLDLYPSAIERLTVEEYKALKKDHSRREPFNIPANVRPLPPYIDNLVKRVDSELERQ